MYARVKGFGDASLAICPSLEQMQGIFDPNDPCQSAPVDCSGGSCTPVAQATTLNWVTLGLVLGGIVLFAAVAK